MSGIRLDQPIYCGPGYHTERTIIVDEQIESPETLTIRLEEEAARGGLRGDSPTGLLSMAAYKPQLQGYADAPYSEYSPQSLSNLQAQNAARLRMAFAANSAASGQYLGAQSGPSISVLSCHPNSGSQGTKVSIKVTSPYDLGSAAMAGASSPFVSVVFGSQRCNAQIQKDSDDANGTCTYTVTADAPQFLSTGSPSLSNVPLTLLVDGPNGEEITRVNDVGTFTYNNAAQGRVTGGSGGIGSSGDTSPPDLGSPKQDRSPVQRASPPHQSLQMQASTSSSSVHQGLAHDPSTNTYGFPPGVSGPTSVSHIQAHAQPDYANTSAAGYSTGAGDMIGSFPRTTSYPNQYPHMPPISLRSPHTTGWAPFGSQVESIRGPAATMSPSHTTTGGPGLSSRHHHPTTYSPRLYRTSLLPAAAGGNGYNPYSGHGQARATLELNGDLGSMAESWSQEEWANKRRLVVFTKRQSGNQLTLSFKPVRISEYQPNSMVISCIWWAEKNECFVTSVDTISLLEALVMPHGKRFAVDEKNRIRRNLEGYHPLTVSKNKVETEDFFKLVMNFPVPKPRHIEKDVKAFPWKTLDNALKKIIGKYSAWGPGMESNAMGTSSHSIIPPGINGSYPLLPPTPNSASTSASESASATGYIGTGTSQHRQVESLTSPRQLPGVSSWPTYATSGGTMSPVVKSEPVTSAGLRISTLTAYDSRGAMQNLTSPYTMSGSSHQGGHHSQAGYSHSAVPVSQSHTRNWDNYSVADGYSTGASHAHGQVYDGGAYGDSTQRA
ncbi:hypothetical protein V8F20_011283 [Naviculisporaceae sp. PSN 640]